MSATHPLSVNHAIRTLIPIRRANRLSFCWQWISERCQLDVAFVNSLVRQHVEGNWDSKTSYRPATRLGAVNAVTLSVCSTSVTDSVNSVTVSPPPQACGRLQSVMTLSTPRYLIFRLGLRLYKEALCVCGMNPKASRDRVHAADIART